MSRVPFAITVVTEVISCDGSTSNRSILYEFDIENTSSSLSGEFRMQITDPSDPAFLFDFVMPISAFATIKKELSLLCDFMGFPQSLNTLLVFCIQKENWKAIIDSQSFNEPMFIVQERTDINIVRPMKLTITKASDSRLNEYLTNEVKKYKSLYNESQSKIKELQLVAENSSQESKSITQQLEQQYKNKLEQLTQLNQTSINEYESKIRLMKSQYNKEIKALEEKYQLKIQQDSQSFADQINSLTETNRQLNEEKHSINLKSERQNERIQLLENRLNDMKEDLQKKDEDGKQTTSTLLQSSQKEVTLQMLNEQLTKEAKKYQTDIENLNQKIAIYEEKIAFTQKELEEKEHEILDMNENYKDYDEIVRQNNLMKVKSKEVITKLSAQISGLNRKCLEQEEQIDDLEEYLLQEESKKNSISSSLDEAHKNIEDLETELRKSETRCEELEKKLMLTQNQIDCLSKQIDDKQIFTYNQPQPKLISPPTTYFTDPFIPVEHYVNDQPPPDFIDLLANFRNEIPYTPK